MTSLADALAGLAVAYCALSIARLSLIVVAGWRSDGQRAAGPASHQRPDEVTIVVPAFNEAPGIAASVRSLAASHHPVREIIVVDDGSTDATAAIVDALALPGVRLLGQPNRGKAMALNTGIAASSGEIVVTVDADTRFDPTTLGHLVAPFAEERVGAVAGNTKVDDPDHLLKRWQRLEYVAGCNADRRLTVMLGFMPTVPGAVGAFRRSALEQVGWLSSDTVAEDTDLTIAIGRTQWRVVYADRAVAWTDVPATVHALWRQRIRWTYGTLQSMWKHRGAWTQRTTRWRRGLSYMVLSIIVVPVLAPLIDVFAISGLIADDPDRIAAWVVLAVIQLAVSAFTLRLDDESLDGLSALPVQQMAFRALGAAVVLRALAAAGLRKPVRWHSVPSAGGRLPISRPWRPTAIDRTRRFADSERASSTKRGCPRRHLRVEISRMITSMTETDEPLDVPRPLSRPRRREAVSVPHSERQTVPRNTTIWRVDRDRA